jgi:hypothetical protein
LAPPVTPKKSSVGENGNRYCTTINKDVTNYCVFLGGLILAFQKGCQFITFQNEGMEKIALKIKPSQTCNFYPRDPKKPEKENMCQALQLPASMVLSN